VTAMLETRLTTLEVHFLEMKDDLTEIKLDGRETRRALAGRPSWPVAGLLAALSSMSVGLSVALMSHI
jgi:hypothetical protein